MFMQKGEVLDFPASVVEFFEGRIGMPYKASPEKLQKNRTQRT